MASQMSILMVGPIACTCTCTCYKCQKDLSRQSGNKLVAPGLPVLAAELGLDEVCSLRLSLEHKSTLVVIKLSGKQIFNVLLFWQGHRCIVSNNLLSSVSVNEFWLGFLDFWVSRRLQGIFHGYSLHL